MSENGKSLYDRMSEIAKEKSELSPEEKDAKAKQELLEFAKQFKKNDTKKKLHTNNNLPESPVKEERQELNLNKPLHTMNPDERVLYAQLHKNEIEQRHLEAEPSLINNKGYKYSAMAEAILGDIFDMPDPDEEIEATESEDVLL